MDDTYIVVCLDDGQTVLATRQVFLTYADAEAYARTVARSRHALVVAGRWTQLRHPVPLFTSPTPPT